MPSFEDTKRIMSPKVHPKSFGTFDKQAPGPQVSLHLTGPLVITVCLLTEMAILLKDVKIIIYVHESHVLNCKLKHNAYVILGLFLCLLSSSLKKSVNEKFRPNPTSAGHYELT